MGVGKFARVFLFVLFAAAASAQPMPDHALKRLIEKRLESGSSAPAKGKLRFDDVCPVDKSVVANRVYREYGAVFAADDPVKVPGRCIFSSEREVFEFQASMKIKKERLGGADIELQHEAMEALLEAVEEASELGVRITPLDGTIAGRRGFADTERLWLSRFLPALNHWVARGAISREDADRARTLPILPQVERVFEWEAQGYFFSTARNKSIMSAVAPPGTSQHLSLLAFDVEQAGNRTVREILNRKGWYQTVAGDAPHFTYLGLPEEKLPGRGLVKIISGGVSYWVPRIVAEPAPIRSK